MKKTNLQLSEIKLVGVTMRTRNSLEANSETAKIGKTVSAYFENNLNQKIAHRKTPEKTFCAYTEYESDENGEYTYFIGEEVDAFEKVPDGFKMLTVPSSNYAKFECGPGPMPKVCVDAWQKIWKMQDDDFGGKRAYIADFEIYDERARDPEKTILDIYIGLC
ncbi:MAG: AraC family transcriptional regulator [Rickettsiales bacterium]|nr:AraC family transcriptional regulator [Rickettsiales bacterium]|tara:strand:- start:3958 stop:4446 length:489 start_codon:yes stop_codon:yes gene_type:complete